MAFSLLRRDHPAWTYTASMTVVDMAQWVSEKSGEPQVECPCGSVWFELVDGAVTLDAAECIVGYAGTLRCKECGRDR